jgi:hypothetical protein
MQTRLKNLDELQLVVQVGLKPQLVGTIVTPDRTVAFDEAGQHRSLGSAGEAGQVPGADASELARGHRRHRACMKNVAPRENDIVHSAGPQCARGAVAVGHMKHAARVAAELGQGGGVGLTCLGHASAYDTLEVSVLGHV